MKENVSINNLSFEKLRYVNGNEMKVNVDNVFDKFFTKQDVANYLFNKTIEIISNYESSLDDFLWIEPSAGNGSFFNLLPKDRRIGIDICPVNNNEIIECDYLKWELPDNKRIIVIGNPPFGHRGLVSLNFIEHSHKAEYVCFILPMFFESNGKGSIKFRVKNFNLIYSEKLPKNSFYNPINNKYVDIKTVFQIWSKFHKVDKQDFNWYKNKNKEPFTDLLKLHTVSLAKKRECGKEWIFDKKPDFYISSTFYGNITVVKNFEEVKYKSGIAIVFTTKDKMKRKILEDILINADWKKYSTLSTNSCYHIGKSNIFKLISDNLNLLI